MPNDPHDQPEPPASLDQPAASNDGAVAESGSSPAGTDPASADSGPATAPQTPLEGEPISLSLLGRLFGVPLIIIGVIVGGAIIVVALFGAPSAPEGRSIDEVLRALEASTGERSAAVLLPREKELWQAALELTLRLDKKDSELDADELKTVVERLRRLVRDGLANVDRIIEQADAGNRQRALRSARLGFLIRALGKTGDAGAIADLVEIAGHAHDVYRRVAIQQLGDMRETPEARKAVSAIVSTLTDGEPRSDETKLVACTALSVLADRGDASATAALTSTLRLSGGGEVEWSAALALARLGSSAGKSVLIDLLDRSFWEADGRYVTEDGKGNKLRYSMPAHRVDINLIAAMDAAANLADKDLWDAIDRLKSDPSVAVRGKALARLKDRPAKLEVSGGP
ncbi:MAG: hypothetical protein IID36_03170 [Planctomycetes bacterium]|nr:hypothetical protein [Planctomycetota bacterium]